MVKRRVVETTEKYGEDGKLVEKITREEIWEDENLRYPEADINKKAMQTASHFVGYPSVGVGMATWAGYSEASEAGSLIHNGNRCSHAEGCAHAIGVPNPDGYLEGRPVTFSGTVTTHASSESSHGCHCNGECHHAEGQRP